MTDFGDLGLGYCEISLADQLPLSPADHGGGEHDGGGVGEVVASDVGFAVEGAGHGEGDGAVVPSLAPGVGQAGVFIA